LTSIENNLQYLYTIKDVEKSLTSQHKLILDSIIKGDSETAKLAAKTHMEFVNKSLTEMNKDKERQERFLHHSSVLSETK